MSLFGVDTLPTILHWKVVLTSNRSSVCNSIPMWPSLSFVNFYSMWSKLDSWSSDELVVLREYYHV